MPLQLGLQDPNTMFPEPPTPGPPVPDVPPDSSRISQGAGEEQLG